MDRAALKCRPADKRPSIDVDRMFLGEFDELRPGFVGTSNVILSIPQPKQNRVFCRTKLRRGLHDGLKNRLDFARRT
jgi:hypothetical protein